MSNMTGLGDLPEEEDAQQAEEEMVALANADQQRIDEVEQRARRDHPESIELFVKLKQSAEARIDEPDKQWIEPTYFFTDDTSLDTWTIAMCMYLSLQDAYLLFKQGIYGEISSYTPDEIDVLNKLSTLASNEQTRLEAFPIVIDKDMAFLFDKDPYSTILNTAGRTEFVQEATSRYNTLVSRAQERGDEFKEQGNMFEEVVQQQMEARDEEKDKEMTKLYEQLGTLTTSFDISQQASQSSLKSAIKSLDALGSKNVKDQANAHLYYRALTRVLATQNSLFSNGGLLRALEDRGVRSAIFGIPFADLRRDQQAQPQQQQRQQSEIKKRLETAKKSAQDAIEKLKALRPPVFPPAQDQAHEEDEI